MESYTVRMVETVYREVEVEAADADDALEKAQRAFDEDEYSGTWGGSAAEVADRYFELG